MIDGPILVTGAAGFIGFHVAHAPAGQGPPVVGLDIINSYYDPALKDARLAELAKLPGFRIRQARSRRPRGRGGAVRASTDFPYVVHLAAQAGVRYSLIDPHAYIDSNLDRLHQYSRRLPAQRLPASAVMPRRRRSTAATRSMPFSVHDNVDHPLSLYGASKKANELMAHSYSHLFKLPTTGLRFFTVYGPWGRPDMAMWLFAKAILAGEPIKLFNHGNMRRDFTYVDDIVESIVRLVDRAPAPDPNWSGDKPDPGSSSGALAGLQYRQ